MIMKIDIFSQSLVKPCLHLFRIGYEIKHEAHRPLQSPEYQRVYTDFLSAWPHHRINKNHRWQRKAEIYSLNTIATNVLFLIE